MYSYFGTRTALHIISVWAVRMFSDLLEILSAKVSKVLISYPLTKAADELLDAQVRDCRVNLCTVSVRWVMSGCWAWCLMDSSVRTCSGRGRVTDVYMSWRWVSEWVSENSPTRESRSIRVCGWGSTSWRPAGSACCSSGRREPAARQTGRRPKNPASARSAAGRTTRKEVNIKLVFWWIFFLQP